ncbi:cysteine desulfurase family protein [Sphingopyxis sp. R3-92]|uniref:cysteine desulfurase family protein n=1 Tax=Sphingopyxis sp. R3-92 TaxID=3158553 RepID=UPI003EE56109
MLDAWGIPGNAASPHAAGERAAALIAKARRAVADAIGAAPGEIIFTSGATEADNLAIVGVARAAASAGVRRRRIVISAVEHKAVLEPALLLEAEGFECVRAPVDRFGAVDLPALRNLVDAETLLVSVMLVNNETGVIQPVAEVARIARAAGALVHSDAAQALGKIAIDVVDLDVDYLSLSAHKCYGPMGVGALYLAAGTTRPQPLVAGGGQQGGLRPGTEPVALLAGFGAAAALAVSRLDADAAHARALAEQLNNELAARQVRLRNITNAHSVVPGSLAILIEGVDADALCTVLGTSVQISTGSACSSGQIKISHVLESMGYSLDDARQVVRIFCHRYLDGNAMTRAADAISAALARSHLAAGDVRQ